MVDNPGDLLDDFADAGADGCTVHIELGDPRPLFDDDARSRSTRRAHAQPRDAVERVLPYLEEIDVLLFMSVHPGLRRAGVHPVGARQARAGAPTSSTSAGWRSSSRSTAASTKRPRRGRRPPAPTSSWPGAPSSTPTTLPRLPGRSGRRHGPRRRDRVTLRAKVLTVSDGVAAGSRDDKSGTRARRPPAGRRLRGRRPRGEPGRS